jgi:hypothetical protein
MTDYYHVRLANSIQNVESVDDQWSRQRENAQMGAKPALPPDSQRPVRASEADISNRLSLPSTVAAQQVEKYRYTGYCAPAHMLRQCSSHLSSPLHNYA